MPTFAPVPTTFSSLSHRSQAIYLYRHILREGAHFFDERTSRWIRSRAQETFAKNKLQTDHDRVQKYMADARKALRLIERANQMDLKAVQRLLRASHGLLGIERRKLLQPLVDSSRVQTFSPPRLATSLSAMGSNTEAANISTSSVDKDTQQLITSIPRNTTDAPSKDQLTVLLADSIQQPEPLFYRKQRTIPPIYSDPVATLITNATKKAIDPTLPQPLFKPLHGKREANLRWRYFSKQITKLKPPLPAEIRQEMEWKARVGLDPSRDGLQIVDGSGDTEIKTTIESSLAWKQWESRILQTIRAWNKNGREQKAQRFETGLFHPSIGGKPAKPNTLTPRLYRRIWQQLLDEVVILDMNVVEENKSSSGSNKGKDAPQPLSPSSFSSKIMYSVSKSPVSYQLRTTKGLRLVATVNDFDQLGMATAPLPESSKTKRKTKK